MNLDFSGILCFANLIAKLNISISTQRAVWFEVSFMSVAQKMCDELHKQQRLDQIFITSGCNRNIKIEIIRHFCTAFFCTT